MPVALAAMEVAEETTTSKLNTKRINAAWMKSSAVFPYTSCEGHCACSLGTQLYVFGGVIQCEGVELKESDKLYKFDINTHMWMLVETKGDKPAARCNATMSSVGPLLYLFGGLSHASGWFNDFYSFHTESCVWTKLEPSTGAPPSPRDKLASATIGHNIFFFGGFGPKPISALEASIEEDEEWSDIEQEGDSGEGDDICGDFEKAQKAAHFGWFNHLHVYDTVSGSWSQPMQLNLGAPTERAAHTLTAMGKWLIVFGGRDSIERCNDLHIYNTETRKWDTSMTIIGEPPQARSFHSSVAIGLSMIVIGGRGKLNQHFSDIHAFDTENKTWTEVVVGGDGPCGRGTHSCHVVGNKLVLFGGSADYSEESMQCQSFYTDTYLMDTETFLRSSSTVQHAAQEELASLPIQPQ